MKRTRGIGRRDKYKASNLNDNTDLRYYRAEMPDIYQHFNRECLRCENEFVSPHRYVRICDQCKIGFIKSGICHSITEEACVMAEVG
jgi:hypothetical protein